MEATLVPLALFLCIAYCVVGVTRAIADARTRRRLVEAGASAELVRAMIGEPPARDPHPLLRWGLVLGAVGLALVGVQFLPYQPEDPLPVGLVLLAGAVGLLAAHAAGRRLAGQGRNAPTVIRAVDRPALPAPAESQAVSQAALVAPSGAERAVISSTPVGADDLE